MKLAAWQVSGKRSGFHYLVALNESYDGRKYQFAICPLLLHYYVRILCSDFSVTCLTQSKLFH